MSEKRERIYQVNELFRSLQGEGRNTGRAAVFIRLSGCNLRCPFCDTDFSHSQPMTARQLVTAVDSLSAMPGLVVITGGEPALQLTDELVDLLHDHGHHVAVETNGTHELPANIDWVTVSPKAAFIGRGAAPVLTTADEVKVIFDGRHQVSDCGIRARHYYLQPCDTGHAERNKELLSQCVDYILEHPRWQLSLQTHKLIGLK